MFLSRRQFMKVSAGTVAAAAIADRALALTALQPVIEVGNPLEWPIEPFMRGADQISVVEFSGSETLDAFLPSAGGIYRMPGDYVWSNQRLPYSQSGQWGYLRVLPPNDGRIKPLTGAQMGIQQATTPVEGLSPISTSRR